MLEVIVSQGRIADRSAQTIAGAACAARALEGRYGVKAVTVGRAGPPACDDWSVSLPQAQHTITTLRSAIEDAIVGGRTPVLVANTCSASLGSLPLVAKHHPEAVLLWVDAHGDFNTPRTTDTGYLGGMVLAAACGLWDSGHGAGLRPEQVVLVGARDIDSGEAELLESSGVRVFPPAEATPESVLGAIGGANVWIHVDWDVLEPGFVPADYEVPGGLRPTHLRDIFAAIPPRRILGVELAEFHLPFDHESGRTAISTILDVVAPLLDMRDSDSEANTGNVGHLSECSCSPPCR